MQRGGLPARGESEAHDLPQRVDASVRSARRVSDDTSADEPLQDTLEFALDRSVSPLALPAGERVPQVVKDRVAGKYLHARLR
jgi:hypothetical protein